MKIKMPLTKLLDCIIMVELHCIRGKVQYIGLNIKLSSLCIINQLLSESVNRASLNREVFPLEKRSQLSFETYRQVVL